MDGAYRGKIHVIVTSIGRSSPFLVPRDAGWVSTARSCSSSSVRTRLLFHGMLGGSPQHVLVHPIPQEHDSCSTGCWVGLHSTFHGMLGGAPQPFLVPRDAGGVFLLFRKNTTSCPRQSPGRKRMPRTPIWSRIISLRCQRRTSPWKYGNGLRNALHRRFSRTDSAGRKAEVRIRKRIRREERRR